MTKAHAADKMSQPRKLSHQQYNDPDVDVKQCKVSQDGRSVSEGSLIGFFLIKNKKIKNGVKTGREPETFCQG